MKAEKVTINIKIEGLSKDILDSMLFKVMDQISQEADSGYLHMDDGDYCEWEVVKTPVEF